jgi:hypothetical protein
MDSEISEWHENFDEKVYKNVDPLNTEATDDAKELSEFTYELDDIYMRHIRQERQEHERAQKRIQLLEDDLARAKRRSAERFTYMKNLNIVRGYLNTKFRHFWYQLSQKEEKIDDTVTLEMLKKNSNRTAIYEDAGYKFAVYVLENDKELGVSRETCKFYILLNEKMHPSISPHAIVERAIQEIKRDSHNDINLQREYNISDEVLDEIVNYEQSLPK